MTGRLTAWLSRLEWRDVEPVPRMVHALAAPNAAQVAWLWGESRIEVRLPASESEGVWCARLARALEEAGVPGSAWLDGRAIRGAPTLVPEA